MNVPETKIEDLLRQAPRPRPPTDLKAQLIEQIDIRPVAAAKIGSPGVNPSRTAGSWLRRWWPALAPAAVSLACAAVFTAQRIEIRQLQATIQNLAKPLEVLNVASLQPGGAVSPVQGEGATEREAQELARLREAARQLSNEVAELEALRQDNDRLRAQLLAPAAGTLNQEEADALAKAREQALNFQCVNNLKQLGLAARVWATDNHDTYPADLLQMTNEMSTPKILYCPADTARTAANGWADYSPANCSYEYLAPSGTDQEPERVLFRCPIHGNIGLCDGRVHSRVAKDHPEKLSERDGKLYFEPNRLPEVATPPTNPQGSGSQIR